MKRITASIITGIMIFCLSACGSSNTEKDSSIVSESRDTQTSEKTKEPETQTVSESSQTEETQTDKSRPEDGEGSQTAEESQKSGDGQDEEENKGQALEGAWSTGMYKFFICFLRG